MQDALNNNRMKRQKDLTQEIDHLSVNTQATNLADLAELIEVRDKFREEAMVKNEKTGKYEVKHKKMSDACDVMMCPKVGNLPFHHYKCCIQRCGSCKPRLMPVTGECVFDDDTPENCITWNQHFYVYECSTHGVIGNTDNKNDTKSKCMHCKDEKDEKKRGTVENTYEKVKMVKPIGVFMRDYYCPFIRDSYRQHQFQIKCLGNKWCGAHRKPKRILKKDPTSITVDRDYTDKIKFEMNGEAQSAGMGNNNDTVGMEGMLFYAMDEDGLKIQCNWLALLSDEPKQDAKTSFCNIYSSETNNRTNSYLGAVEPFCTSGATVASVSTNLLTY